MTVLKKIDELNRLSMPYDKYFGEMSISHDEVLRRIEFADILEDVFFYIFLLIGTSDFSSDELIGVLRDKLTDTIRDYGLDIKKYDLDGYIDLISKEIIESTLNDLDEDKLSEDRAKLITENEVNSVYNKVNLVDAQLSGKKFKTWVTMGDKNVRLWHEEINMKTIPITEKFLVGTDEMDFPHDPTASMQNTANCRCICTYT